jgi:hypothetical protein
VDFVTANKFAEDADVGEATVESGIPVCSLLFCVEVGLGRKSSFQFMHDLATVVLLTSMYLTIVHCYVHPKI